MINARKAWISDTLLCLRKPSLPGPGLHYVHAAAFLTPLSPTPHPRIARKLLASAGIDAAIRKTKHFREMINSS